MAIFGKSMLDSWGVNWCKLSVNWSTGAGSRSGLSISGNPTILSCLQNATRKSGFPRKKKTKSILSFKIQPFLDKKHLLKYNSSSTCHSKVDSPKVMSNVVVSWFAWSNLYSRVWKLQESPHRSQFLEPWSYEKMLRETRENFPSSISK